ncbi:uncharacterized protein DUF1565 [Natranaerovirga hydrolytica]|uniref:Uncharacterized protein DUF1565 n=1 Tax=Natranaerovirga hydrolytica TaxID=680378 RepID=A0A4R1MJ36_9FIRM|nr:right-handed parallel beta-helix repeat-containing protein [Natranaerovirga hydrolytica]TCK92768.1 uncharacterized protein DUF1565 [Natranaerovirga hydrolytica]
MNFKKSTFLNVFLIFSLIFSSLTFLSGEQIVVANTSNVLLEDNFNNQSTGSIPNGYTVDESGGTVRIANVPSSNNKSVHLNNSSTSSNVKLSKDFDAQNDIITMEFQFMQPVVNSSHKIMKLYDTQGTIGVFLETSGGNLSYRHSNNTYTHLESYNANTWYDFKIVADITNNKADVYINGNLKIINADFYNPVSNLSSFTSYTPNSDTHDHYINNIKVMADGPTDSEPEVPTPTLPEIPDGDRTFYVATNGSNNNNGSESSPFETLTHAIGISQPGDVIVMREGTYYHDTRITVNNSGNSSKPITIVNYPGETPILDFWAQEEQPGRDGLRLNGDHWHIIGIHLTGAGGNGFRIHGSNNTIERCVAFENRLTGFHLEDGSYNLFLNNDSYRNFNLRGRVGNMADGFAAKYEALGPGNVFYGNRSWENSDDGFDFWMATSTIVLENNWAFGNGNPDIWNHPDFDGGGNGFKLGGNHLPGNHIVSRNMAFDNHGKGFDHNNNTGALTLIHNTGYNNGIRINGRNFDFPNNPANGQHTFINNLSAQSPVDVRIASNSVQQGNSWQIGNVTPSMFYSVNTALAKSPRQPDGSLPDIDLFVPRPDSFLVNGGVSIGEPYNGSAPDIGAIEY